MDKLNAFKYSFHIESTLNLNSINKAAKGWPSELVSIFAFANSANLFFDQQILAIYKQSNKIIQNILANKPYLHMKYYLRGVNVS